MKKQETSPSLEEGEGYGNLADIVAYQRGAIVSRTFMKTEGGNLTLFAFDKSEGLSEHTTPHDALVWILEGNVEIDIQGQNFRLKQGEFIRLPAHVPHALRAVSQMKMALLLLF